MKQPNLFKSRRFKHGTMATVMTVLFVVAVVIVNIIASLILDRLPVEADLTSDKIYQLSDESVEFAKSIDIPVQIIVCKDKEDLEGSTIGKQATQIIEKYAQSNSNISVEYIDLLDEPEIATKYSEYNVEDYSVILETDKRTKVVSMNDFIETETDYTTYETTYMSSAEQIMTSALMYVTDDEVMQVSVLTGHSEMDSSALTSMLADNNYEATEQSIVNEEINPDATIAIIYAPTLDYTEDELKKLDDFLDNDGKLGKTLIYVSDYQQKDLPNLNSFLKEWGIEPQSGVIAETDTSNIYDTRGYTYAATYADETYTEDLRNPDLPFLGNYASPISLLWESDNSRTTTMLLTSSETSILVPTTEEEQANFDASKAEQQAYGLAALSQRTKSGDNEQLTSNVLAFGGTAMFYQNIAGDSRFNNNEYTVNLINKLSGKEASINIASVSFDAEALTVTQGQYTAIFWVFAIVIPVVTLVLGIVIWLRRRNK